MFGIGAAESRYRIPDHRRAPADELRLRAAAASYRSAAGWPVRATADAVVIAMGTEVIGVAVPSPVGTELLALLALRQYHGPAVRLPGRHPAKVLLVRPDAGVSWRLLPSAVSLIGRPAELPLPPTVLADGPVEWAAPLGNGRGELFPAAVVHDALITLALAGRPVPAPGRRHER
ncbi:hypothetical protein [Amycolatopsis sp. NPDC059021]|uniref:hypothetical protein n=1 Tax=Amycolatopsis sp. NPDC059021 TaxID=3346704 RepID=UPI00366D6CE8